MTTFHIIGDDELSTETELEKFSTRSEAIRWAERYCRRDLGGYSHVAVVANYGDYFKSGIVFYADDDGWKYYPDRG